MKNQFIVGLVFNKRGRLYRDGKGEISIRLYEGITQKTFYIPTGIRIYPEQWDRKRQKVTALNYNYIEINKRLGLLVEKVERLIFERENNGDWVSFEYLKSAIIQRQKYADFIAFATEYVESSKTMAKQTRAGYTSMLSHLKRFRGAIPFDTLNYRFVHEFEAYLLARMRVNTAGKYLMQLKTIVNNGIRLEVIQEGANPFRGFKIRGEQTSPKYLQVEEVEAIEALDLSNQTRAYEYVRDMFLFSVYTGLRISDTTRVSPKHLEQTEEGVYLVMEMRKTRKPLRLPLSALFNGKALELLRKYEDGKAPYFGRLSDGYINRLLKHIGAMAGISKRITFHTSRHTNATYLLNKGVSLSVVQRVLGHTKQSTTEIYARILDKTITEELDKAFKQREQTTSTSE